METTESVGVLWDLRCDLAQPNKRQRLRRFYEVFMPLIQSLSEGTVYTLDAMQRSPWWEHLRPKYKRWRKEPESEVTIEQMRTAFQASINLFYSIRENGVRDPLVMYMEAGNRHLILGYRRLVIAHVVGVEVVKVWTHADYAAYKQWRRTDGQSSSGSLEFNT